MQCRAVPCCTIPCHAVWSGWSPTTWLRYKPSGSFFLPEPAPSAALSPACGIDEAADEVLGGAGQCAEAQVARRRAQRPFTLTYVRDGGADGYYMLSPKYPPP